MAENGCGQAREAPLGPAVRDRIMKRFGAWLDRVLAGEPPPEGLPKEILDRIMGEEGAAQPAAGEPGGDLSSMVAVLTALTTEVKLQGRTFKDLREILEPVAGHDSLLRRLLAAVEEKLGDRGEERLRQAERRTQRELLAVLLDVRDRLERGLLQARRRLEPAPRSRRPWRLSRIFGQGGDDRREERAVLQALEEGYALGLARLDDALGGMGVEVVAAGPGATFDPRTMNAVGMEETAEEPEGTVREVYRTGYRWNGEMFRTAEVKVTRLPAGKRSSHGA